MRDLRVFCGAMVKSIAILGATGSIGTQALDIASRYPERFCVEALTAHTNAEALFQLCREHEPRAAGLVVEPEQIPDDLRHIDWYFGEDASERVVLATKPEYALAAVVGIAGLPAVLASMEVCERVLLANKEALVTGGELVMIKAKQKNVQLMPVDSEHSAIYQCMRGALNNLPLRLILTASGGPFRTWNKSDIEHATVSDALGHPTWNMGSKITVDCATMMNKGLEVIEAHHLFRMPLEKIDVIVHPQSVIHSMVEYRDSAVMAQLGLPDMRAAIGYAMGYPERLSFAGRRLDFAQLGSLTFEEPDFARFPCLAYAREAQKQGGNMPVVLNGANEVAVEAFLKQRIRFGGIAEAVDYALQHTTQAHIDSIEGVYQADRDARRLTAGWVLERAEK